MPPLIIKPPTIFIFIFYFFIRLFLTSSFAQKFQWIKKKISKLDTNFWLKGGSEILSQVFDRHVTCDNKEQLPPLFWIQRLISFNKMVLLEHIFATMQKDSTPFLIQVERYDNAIIRIFFTQGLPVNLDLYYIIAQEEFVR